MIVKVTTTGLSRLEAKADRRSIAISKNGVQNILREMGKSLVQAYREKISSFMPGSVPDLAESTKKQKMRQVGFVYPILIRSGYWISSMRSTVRSVSRGFILSISFPGSHPGGSTNDEIARAHIEGGPHLPSRDFTAVPAQWRKELIQRLRDRLRNA